MKRNDELAKELYAMYESGMTLREIGQKTKRSNQAVHKMFVRRGWPLRKRPSNPKRYFNGKKYSEKPSGYWIRTDRSRGAMHRDIWEYYNGPIPEGFQIHHINGIRGDNDINNLEMVEAAEHSRRHMKTRMYTHVCPNCGACLV